MVQLDIMLILFVFKVFGKAKLCRTVSGYDPVIKLYHVIYNDDDDDTENTVVMKSETNRSNSHPRRSN